MQAVLLVAVFLVIVVIRAQSDDIDEAVTMNQAAQIFQNPHLVTLSVLFLVIYTLKQLEYHMGSHENLKERRTAV